MRIIAITVAALALCGWATSAQAGPYAYGGYGSSGYGGGYGRGHGGQGWNSGRGAIYHPPSVHLDRVYHPDYSHWTPGRGVHSHGHYDAVPHYTPGHRDTLHGNHIHFNPRFHH